MTQYDDTIDFVAAEFPGLLIPLLTVVNAD